LIGSIVAIHLTNKLKLCQIEFLTKVLNPKEQKMQLVAKTNKAKTPSIKLNDLLPNQDVKGGASKVLFGTARNFQFKNRRSSLQE